MTNLLLDTHIMIWCVFSPEVLTKPIEQEILHARRVFVPAPALYEAVRAITVGRVKGAKSKAAEALPDLIKACGFEVLDPDQSDWIAAAGFGWPHGDPFDRVIYAMAKIRNLALVTADEKLLGVPSGTTIDAR